MVSLSLSLFPTPLHTLSLRLSFSFFPMRMSPEDQLDGAATFKPHGRLFVKRKFIQAFNLASV